MHAVTMCHAGGPALLSSDVAQGGELLFVGAGLLGDAMKHLVERCSKAIAGGPPPKPLRTVASVTSAERAQIAKDRMFDPLPEEVFFNGTHYCDSFGDRLKEHPYMDKWVTCRPSANR